MDEKLTKYIYKNGYSALLNNTKWKEIVTVLENIEKYNPRVYIKYIYETEIGNKNKISHHSVWWSEVECEGFEYIEYLEINPIKEIYIGRLVESRKEDFSKIIQNGLDKYTIPYENDNGIFKIYGYRK